MFPSSSYYDDDYRKVYDRYYPSYVGSSYYGGNYSGAYARHHPINHSVYSAGTLGGYRYDVPIPERQTWTDRIALPRRWTDVVENERVDLIPVPRSFQCDIEIQHDTEYVPNQKVMRRTELAPFERYYERLDYLPVKQTNLKNAWQGDIREGRSVISTANLYDSTVGRGYNYGGVYGTAYPGVGSQSVYGYDIRSPRPRPYSTGYF